MAAQIQGMDLDYKPWGGLAGIMAGDREAETEAANLLALQESQLGNIVKQRDASFAQDEMGNPELRSGRIQGMIGDAQVKTAAGLTAKGTQQSDMAAKLAENIAKVPKAQVEKALQETHLQTQGLMGLAQVLESGGGSDLNFMAKAMEAAPQLGMSPQDLQQLLQNPQLLARKIAQNQERLTMVPEVLRKVYEENIKAENTEVTHQGDRESREKVAQIEASSRAAERKATREASAEAKKESEAMRKEQEITRRLEHGRGKLKLLQEEYRTIDEAITTPVYGLSKDEKAARKTRLDKEKADIKKQAQKIGEELDRLATLSTFAPKSGAQAEPIKLD